MSSHLCCQLCVWSLEAGYVMTVACHGVGPGCTVMGGDDVCGGMFTAWVAAAVMGSLSAGVMAASPWMVRRRWWRSARSAQVLVGSVIEWRRMAWSPGVISFQRSVPLWTAYSRGRFRSPLRSRVVRYCWGGAQFMVNRRARGSWWGRSLVFRKISEARKNSRGF